MTKTEINKILKELGYGNMRRNNNKIVKDHAGKMLKGIWLANKSPMSITSPEYGNFDKLLNSLLQHFSIVEKHHSTFYTLKSHCGKHKMIILMQEFNSYPMSENMDPYYLTKYASITVQPFS